MEKNSGDSCNSSEGGSDLENRLNNQFINQLDNQSINP